jgi:cytochrome c biogenesis protein CcmG/thiol:disulfide interchange protein DsbE
MKAKHLIPLILFLAMSLLLGIGLTLDPKDLPSTMINKPAPAFSLNLLQQPEKTFSPADYHGQRWILNVWASWCVACRYEHPLLNEIANKTDIPLVGLNYKDEPDAARKWLQERGNPYDKSPMDIAGNAGIDWGVYGVPETFVIDEAGLVIYKHTGPITADVVNNEILPLFKPATAESPGAE